MALEEFLAVLTAPGLDERSERLQVIQFRVVLEQSLLPAMDRSGFSHQFELSLDLRGSELIDALFDDIEAIIL